MSNIRPGAGINHAEACDGSLAVNYALTALGDMHDAKRVDWSVIEAVREQLERAREVLSIAEGDLDPDREAYGTPHPYYLVEAPSFAEAPKVTHDGEDGSLVEVTFYLGEADGVPVVQIDTRDATVRVNVNDGELATVHDGGERITLPEHWTEYEQPEGE